MASIIKIDSFEELVHHHLEILRRIADTHNGSNLFLAHPFMLLEDIGVIISKEVQYELLKKSPALFYLSSRAFTAIKRHGKRQPNHVKVNRLFTIKD
jgi:hypothetical protein